MKVLESIAIDDAQPGMRLAEAVADAMGQVLVPAGSELTESMLQGLRRREIAALTVEREIEEDSAAREARRARVVEQLDQLFRKAGDGAETRQLYQAILDFRLEQPQ
ncbi:hypothetical protein [Dechloromonas sp. A34]|uniref:hypothetical protein n=1 Tax=Dechloromonas sp. A34 TaxID=447588 RepID=UPI002249877C|nr:hypothetical protein [Dechloromonas sp. A34]